VDAEGVLDIEMLTGELKVSGLFASGGESSDPMSIARSFCFSGVFMMLYPCTIEFCDMRNVNWGPQLLLNVLRRT
jgi:hypothetical protein